MINASELRIGNILLADYGYGSKIVAIKSGYDIQSALEDQDNWNPVHLTPEILEKCGFVFNTYWETEIVDLSEDKDGFFLCTEDCHEGDIYRLGKGFHFLHQLQNLFYCLSGQELEVKL